MVRRRAYARYPVPFAKRINRINGGMVDKLDELHIEDNQFAELNDWQYDNSGNLRMRGGLKALTSGSASDTVRYITHWKRDDTDEYYNVFVAGDKVYYKDGLSVTQLGDGLDPNEPVCMESYENRLFVVQPGQPVKVVDSNLTWRNAGCEPPTVAPDVATGSAGVLDGRYKYAYSWLYPWGESSGSPVSDEVEPSEQKVDITVTESYPAGATGIKFYRTSKGLTILKELATVSSPTTTYEDNNTDGVLGLKMQEDAGAPPQSSWIKEYKNYMYYIKAGSNEWYYSGLTNPETVQDHAYDNPVRDLRNLPTAVEYTANPNFLVVFYEKALLSYIGTSPFVGDDDSLRRREVNWTLGCRSPYTISKIDGNILFLGSDNRLYLLTRVSLAVSETVEPMSLSEPIDRLLQEDLNQDMVSKFQGVMVNRKFYLLVATRGSDVLNRLLVVDFNIQPNPWYTAYPSGGAGAIGSYEDESKKFHLILGGVESTNILQYDTGPTDNGLQINPYLKSKRYDLRYPFHRKVWRKIRIHGQGSPEFSFKVKVNITKKGATKTKEFDVRGLAVSGELLNVAKWASGQKFGEGAFCSTPSWSTDVVNFTRELDIRDDGEFMQFEITDLTSTYRLLIKGFELTGHLYRARAR